MRNYIILFLSLWAVIIGILAPTDIYLILLLIGLLITVSIGENYLTKEGKFILKSLIYVLLLLFISIVVNKIYDILVK